MNNIPNSPWANQVEACLCSDRFRTRSLEPAGGGVRGQGSGVGLVDPGDDAVGHGPAVVVPGRAVLPAAVGRVAGVAMDQQDDEVDHVVPRQQVAETYTHTHTHRGKHHVVPWQQVAETYTHTHT